MVYTVNAFIPTEWKVLPSRVPDGKGYYRIWVNDTSDIFLDVTTEQREAPDQHIGNRPPVAMLNVLQAKALRHLLDGFIARAEARKAAEPRHEFSDVQNLPDGVTMDELIRHATNHHLDAMQKSYPSHYLSKKLADEEMAKRRARQNEIRQRQLAAPAPS